MTGALIRVECPHCSGPIEFVQESAGQVVPCPHCSQSLLLTAPLDVVARVPALDRELKRRANARFLKTVGALMAIGSMVGCMSHGSGDPKPSDTGFLICMSGFGLGLILFIIGRFSQD